MLKVQRTESANIRHNVSVNYAIINNILTSFWCSGSWKYFDILLFFFELPVKDDEKIRKTC